MHKVRTTACKPFAALLAALVFNSVLPPTALAQTSESSLAQTLFDEGKRLMDEKNYAQACPKLAESHRLGPGGGTLLNLALCHEAEGKTASAWSEFKDALAMAKRDGRAERAETAETHLTALEPKLSRMTLVLAPGADVVGLEIHADAVAIPRAAWGAPFPIDPGRHTFRASAPGKREWRHEETSGEGESKSVSVPALENEPAAATASSQPAPVAAAPADNRGSSQRVAGLVVGGVGLVVLGVGTHFGLQAISKRSDSDASCINGSCDARGVALNDDAKTAANISTATFVIGGLAVATGVVLMLTAPRARSASAALARPEGVRVSPVAHLQGGGLSVGGAW